jgi:hypothetical protein
MPIPKDRICYCLRCGKRWVKRVKGSPRRCPKCKRLHWDVKAGVMRRGPAPGSPEARRGSKIKAKMRKAREAGK